MYRFDQLHIIWNITHFCNFACKYCYYDKEMQRKPAITSLDLAELFIKKVADCSFKTIRFIFHGGEPLTLKMDYYKRIINLQEHYLKDKTIINSIQTNGSLLDEETISFLLKENNFRYSVSLDGIRIIHDKNRVFKNGEGTFDTVVKKLRLLEKYNFTFSILSVCSDMMVENIDEIYQFYKSFNGLEGVDFILPNNEGPKVISKNNTSTLIIRLFDLWFNDPDCNFSIRILKTMISSFFGISPGLCTFIKKCVISFPVISLDPYGDITPCDCSRTGIIGNIKTDKIDDLIYHNEVRRKAAKLEEERIESCYFCKWYQYCRGACPTYVDNGENYYCEDLKKIFHHIYTVIKERKIFNENDQISIDSLLENVPNKLIKKHIYNFYSEDNKGRKKTFA